MEKIKLSIKDLLNLELEIFGIFQEEKEIFKGFINQKIKLTTKYWLSILGEKLKTEKQLIEKLKQDLIKKYGKQDNDTIYIPYEIEVQSSDDGFEKIKTINPDMIKFYEETEKLLSEEKEIEVKLLDLKEFEIEAEENYPYIFKFLIKKD